MESLLQRHVDPHSGISERTHRDRQLVPATQRDEGFPNIPGYPFQGNQINYAEKFNFGPGVNYQDETGIVTIQPPQIERIARITSGASITIGLS